MATYTFSMSFGKNEGLLYNPTEFWEQFMFGLSKCSKTGLTLTYDTIKRAIVAATGRIELFLGVKFVPQIITERLDYLEKDYQSFGVLTLTFPCVQAFLLNGKLNGQQILAYPASWLTSYGNNFQFNPRKLNLVPNGSSVIGLTSGIVALTFLAFWNYDNVPAWFEVFYATGFSPIPEELLQAVGMLAAINLLPRIGELLQGAGTASESISFDGLSQSISTLKNQEYGAFTGLIKAMLLQYQDLPGNLRQIRGTYGGGRPMATV